jgi:hypothetical protein
MQGRGEVVKIVKAIAKLGKGIMFRYNGTFVGTTVLEHEPCRSGYLGFLVFPMIAKTT